MKLAVVSLMILTVACGSGDGSGGDDGASDKFNQTNVSGMVSGAAWTFVSGRVQMDAVPGAEENVGKFELFSSDVANECDGASDSAADKKNVNFSAALIPGETPIGASGKIAVFFDNSAGDSLNTTAYEGKWSLDNIAAGSVSGRLIAHADAENSVNGIFTVPRCCKSDNGVTYEVCTTL